MSNAARSWSVWIAAVRAVHLAETLQYRVLDQPVTV